MGFVIGSYRAVEHLGSGRTGHRTSPFWRAEDARTVEDVALTVLPVECAQTVRDAVDSIGETRHPHLLPISDVVEDDTRLALVCPWPRGGRLIELVRRRGTLSVGETVTVVLPLAGAVAELHGAEVRHGAVCPEMVWFDARGRPLLGPAAIGTVVAAVAGQAALGSADIAPEVLRQARTGPAGPSADVFSLGSVALFCLTGRSAWPADDPADVLVQSAAGQWPDPPDDAGPTDLIDLIRSMLRRDPGERPAAGAVVRRLAGLAEPEPIRFGAGPCPTPASSRRWRGWAGRVDDPVGDPVDRTAGDTGPDAAGYPHDDSAEDAEAGDGAAESDTPARPGAHARRGPLARLGIALLTGLLLTVLVAQVGSWLREPPESAAPATVAAPGAEGGPTDWTRVVSDLDQARSRALAAADPGLLGEVYLTGSAAAEADTEMIDRLAGSGWRVVDGRHDIVSVQVVDGGDPARADGPIRLAVVDRLSARPVVDGSGHQVSTTTARGEQRRIMVLDATDQGYRISGIEPG